MKKLALHIILLLFGVAAQGATYTVTTAAFGTTVDGISLRWAITQANSNPGADLIDFNIPGAAPHTIICTSDLPNITDVFTVIDGSSQPPNGFAGVSPKVILQGSGAGEGLYVQNYRCEIYGFYIHGFNYGVRIANAGDSITIGSATNGHRNVISGNNIAGIYGNSNAYNFNIKGNYIGVDILGTSDEGNGGYGIYVGTQTALLSFSDSEHEIGGLLAAERNIISGNDGGGIFFGSRNIRAKVINNYIGTDVTGTVSLANSGHGIVFSLFSGAITHLGRCELTSNVISNNTGDGMRFSTNASFCKFTNNYIGVDATGTLAMGNGGYGINFTGNFPGNVTIGASCTFTGNVIANSVNSGMHFSNNAFRCVFRGNMIGTNAAGTVAMGNGGHGLRFGYMSASISVGALDTIESNVISANTLNGISYEGNNAMHTFIDRNRIGVDATGEVAMGNGGHGIYYAGYFTSAITVGTDSKISYNIISNNGGSGIYYDQAIYTSWQKIIGNYIGVDITGTVSMGNGGHGIYIGGTQYSTIPGIKTNAQIGGMGAGEGNIISNNVLDGIRFDFTGSASAGFSNVEGNIIGTDINSSANMGNGGYGVNFLGINEDGNNISCNTIAYNTNEGVNIVQATSTDNRIAGNAIFCNAQAIAGNKGIQLNGLANNNIAAPVILVANATTVSGTGPANSTIELFISDETGSCSGNQAEHYLDATTSNGAGVWAYPVTLPITVISGNVTAVAIDASNDASEISNSLFSGLALDLTNVPERCSSPAQILPVELLLFSAQYNVGSRAVDLKWVTATELNNDGFRILKSNDAVNFISIAWVEGSGNSVQTLEYSIEDDLVNPGELVYYQLEQVDHNGAFERFDIIPVQVPDLQNVVVFPNPVTDLLTIDLLSIGDRNITLYNALGASVKYVEVFGQRVVEITTAELPSGVYSVQINSGSHSTTLRIVVL